MSKKRDQNSLQKKIPNIMADDHGFNAWNALQNIFTSAVIVATLFTLWTPSTLFSDQLLKNILFNMQADENPEITWPTPTAALLPRIGIVAGHWGNDPGAVCPDGLSEMEVNLRIATLVQQYLMEEGFNVDLLQEFDKRLYQYQALAIVSIHCDSCDYINDEATGFKVAAAVANQFPEKSDRLTSCLAHRYQQTTNLHFHNNTITPDMTSYHAFNEIHTSTPAAIIEAGFLNLDRAILTEQPELVAKGITAGILCYVRNETIPSEESMTPP